MTVANVNFNWHCLVCISQFYRQNLIPTYFSQSLHQELLICLLLSPLSFKLNSLSFTSHLSVNMAQNGIEYSTPHDELQYLKLVKTIIDSGL